MKLSLHARAGALALIVCVAAVLAGGSMAASSSQPRAGSWASIVEKLRPVVALDGRSVIVVFDDDPHAEAGGGRKAYRMAQARQTGRLAALRAAGISFDVEHRYLQLVNGAALRLHDDSAAQLASLPGVASVHRVRPVYPAAADAVMPPSGAFARKQDTAARQATDAAGPARPNIRGSADLPAVDRTAVAPRRADAVVALLDTAVDFNHPSLAPFQAGPVADVVTGGIAQGASGADLHGTASAGLIVQAAAPAGRNIAIQSIRVLSEATLIGGETGVIGTTADLVAGLEIAVDPDGDGATRDMAEVIALPVVTPHGAFENAPEVRAAAAAANLGATVVAAAGNDGAPDSPLGGTVSGLAAAEGVLGTGAVDLRAEVAAVAAHISGGGVDHMEGALPLLTAEPIEKPSGTLPVREVRGGADIVDYLDENARSRVDGAAVLVRAPEAAAMEAIARAAADAGAGAVLVADTPLPGGTLAGPGVDIPVVALSAEYVRLLDATAAPMSVELLPAPAASNPSFGKLAGFSSRGTTYAGAGAVSLLAQGVAIETTAPGVDASGNPATTIVTGTSAAAADAAGRAAVLAASRPGWDSHVVAAALTSRARELPAASHDGDAAIAVDPFAHGAGIIDLAAALAAEQVPQPPRVDFGIVRPGKRATRPLSMRAVGGTPLGRPALASRPAPPAGIELAYAGAGQIAVRIAGSVPDGRYGGTITAGAKALRIPWTVVVDRAAGTSMPVKVDLSDAAFAPARRSNDFPAKLMVRLGVDAQLGVRAADALRLRIRSAGKDRAVIQPASELLPGSYVIGISGYDGRGMPLKPGRYQLVVELDMAGDGRRRWQRGDQLSFEIQPGMAHKDAKPARTAATALQKSDATRD